jgi:Peptidase M76 family
MVDPATIVLCVNQMHRGKAEVEEVLVHELVHAYDFCAAKRDLSRYSHNTYPREAQTCMLRIANT